MHILHKCMVGSILSIKILPFKQNITIYWEVDCIHHRKKDDQKTVWI